MTPAQKAGWKVGDRGRVSYGGNGEPVECFSEGSIVELLYDDGSGCPYFKLIHGWCRFTNAHGTEAAFEDLPNVKKISDKAQILREIADEIDRVGEGEAHKAFEVLHPIGGWVDMVKNGMWNDVAKYQIRRKPQKITLELDREVIDKAREVGVESELAKMILGAVDEKVG